MTTRTRRRRRTVWRRMAQIKARLKSNPILKLHSSDEEEDDDDDNEEEDGVEEEEEENGANKSAAKEQANPETALKPKSQNIKYAKQNTKYTKKNTKYAQKKSNKLINFHLGA